MSKKTWSAISSPSLNLRFRLGLFLCVALLTSASVAFTEPAYSWVGPDGRTYFGSKPAKNATSVKKLDTKPLSRYSTDKMLKRLGWDEKRMEAQKAMEKEALAGQNDGVTSQVPGQDSDKSVSDAPTELEHDEVQVSTNENGAIVSCSVTVNNTTRTTHSGISVAFELSDGTLVPGEGPDSLAAAASADYAMPADLLPLSLEPAKDGEQKGSLVRKVLIHATADDKS